MIRKQQILSFLVLLSLGAIFTTNLKATENTANGNAFIIGTTSTCAIWLIFKTISDNNKDNNNNKNKDKDNLNTVMKPQTTMGATIVTIGTCLMIGWSLKNYFTKLIIAHVKNKNVQNIVMVGIGIIVTTGYFAFAKKKKNSPKS